MFSFLAGTVIVAAIVIAQYFLASFSLGAWVGGLILFTFAWIDRAIAFAEASTPSTQ